MEEVNQFLESQTREIKRLYIQSAYAWWDSMISGKLEDYKKSEKYSKEYAKFFNNNKNFEIVKRFLKTKIKDRLVERQLKLLYNSYLGSQGDISLINKIIKKSTEIEKKFNTFRAKVDEKELTDNEIKEILKKDLNSERLQKVWEASKEQGALVEKDLIELVKLRNQLAKSLGFNNYYEMSLFLNEQKKEEIKKIFDELYKLTKRPFKKVKQEIDYYLKKRLNVKEIKPWHYQELFFQTGPEISKVKLNKYCKNILRVTNRFYSNMGLETEDIFNRSDLYEKKGKYQHACCMSLDKTNDIRVIMNLKDDAYWFTTSLHELGHAVYDKYIDKKLPFLLREASHILTTEAIALLLERNSKNLLFIKRYLNVNSNEIEQIQKDIEISLKIRQLVFSSWEQVMVNFEMKMYEHPDQNLNKLWYDLIKKYQLIDFERDKPDWASKIHIATSPAYYHNYMLGELYASQINNYITKNILKQKNAKNLDYGDKEIGNYLISKIFSPGTKYPWNELIKYSTGEELNLKYWVKEFC